MGAWGESEVGPTYLSSHQAVVSYVCAICVAFLLMPVFQKLSQSDSPVSFVLWDVKGQARGPHQRLLGEDRAHTVHGAKQGTFRSERAKRRWSGNTSETIQAKTWAVLQEITLPWQY